MEAQYISKYHEHQLSEHQCSSFVVKHIKAPVDIVWSLVRRFDQPQSYKPFVSRCTVQGGDLKIGSVRQVNIKSGLPATTSTERLELLDDQKHILGVKFVGGDHRLKNYSSIITVHPEIMEGRQGTVVIESFVVDAPEGNTKDDTCYFVRALISCNLNSLADVSERMMAMRGQFDQPAYNILEEAKRKKRRGANTKKLRKERNNTVMQGDEADAGGASASASAAAEEGLPVCNFFRKPAKSKNVRKRTAIQEGVDEDEDSKLGSSVVYNKKKPPAGDNKLHFSSGSQKTSKESEVEKSKSSVFEYESSKQIQVQNDSRATATLETETDFSRDSRAIRERVLKQAEEALKGKKKGDGDEKLYKGLHGYTDYKAGFRREQTVSSEKAGGSHGPLRASAHIRVSARFDYQPDICKDYKETGYCGYGDSCKFMHDRGDYKSGWQLERDWDEKEKARKRKLAMKAEDDDEEKDSDASDEEDDENGLPFACFICREPFTDPVMTRCKHYFCEHCALKHHAKNKKCFVCNQPTNGIFNTAFEIRKRMAAEKK
ncbi:hypothetical protein ABFS83_02G173200 [Erythranthe nasuta]